MAIDKEANLTAQLVRLAEAKARYLELKLNAKAEECDKEIEATKKVLEALKAAKK